MKPQLFLPIAFQHLATAPDNIIVLAGDIGGTKANMALFKVNGNGFTTLKEQRYSSKNYHSFQEILNDFLAGQPTPQRVCLSVAGPIIEGSVKFTNLSWEINAREISSLINNCPVAILNDLEATAYGLAALKPDEVHILHKGKDETPGNIGILAAGTGLGEAGMYFDGKAYHPFATEGGHSDFAPRTLQDIELMHFLLEKYPKHVSWERLLSGLGIENMWDFLTQREKKHCPSDVEATIVSATDKAAAISHAAAQGICPVCIEALALFNRYLSIEAANLILKFKATGGLYLAGGIAPKVLPLLKPEVWDDTFQNSGRMRQLLAEVTVYVVLNQQAPLLGAGYYAWLGMQ
jgi:glucokinase